MKIFFRKKFKKLREEYADLGEAKLDLIESIIDENPFCSPADAVRLGKTQTLDDVVLPRSTEYFIKYRALVGARTNVRIALIGSGAVGLSAWLSKKVIDVCKNNSTLEHEYNKGYFKGRSDQMSDWEDMALEADGQDAYLGDTLDDRHLYIKVSDEVTEECKALSDL